MGMEQSWSEVVSCIGIEVFSFDLLPRASFSHSETQSLHLQIGMITHLKSDENTQQEPWPAPGHVLTNVPLSFHFFLPLPPFCSMEKLAKVTMKK